MDKSGWTVSAAAWIAHVGSEGDAGRRYVLDPALRAQFGKGGFRRALDMGCGEGRLCRIMQEYGIATVGIDPTEPMIEAARRLDPKGDYRVQAAEALDLPDASFDLVVSCLTMIDITDFRAAISESSRVLQPGGTFLVANLTPLISCSMGQGWEYDAMFKPIRFIVDNYMREWSAEVAWSGIAIRNWHRPFGAYMQAYRKAGFAIESYEELMPVESYDDRDDRYARIPWFDLIVLRKEG